MIATSWHFLLRQRAILATGAALLGALATVPGASAADFSTSEGFAAACAPGAATVPAANDDARIAFVICHDTALTKQIISWGTQGMKRMQASKPDQQTVMVEVIKEIDYVRDQLALTRKTLEQVHLGKRKSLRIAPAQWQMDMNGDGNIDLWEKYLFAIPKRGLQAFRFAAPSNDQAYYDKEYQLDAVIRVDQSDVLWALSYHNFIEGLLTNLRAFDLSESNHGLLLARPELLKVAHRLIGRGLALSAQLRKSVLAETGDDQEWIGNPNQASSVFPIPLDAQDFAAWGSILDELSALWQGRHLLPTTQGQRGLIAEFAPLCPPGKGLNIAKVYLQPPAAGTEFSLGRGAKLSSAHCQAVDARHPLSSLQDLVEKAQKSGAGMQFLRYLYWTN
jgi:hypothetical protein